VAASGRKILIGYSKPERETAVRALLKGRHVLTVLPTGNGPRKQRFCHRQTRLHRFGREFQGGVNIP